jgi:hypothetical protein
MKSFVIQLFPSDSRDYYFVRHCQNNFKSVSANQTPAQKSRLLAEAASGKKL